MAGSISHKQLMLSKLMGDPLLASKSKLFYAFSLLQQHKLLQAKRIIRLVPDINIHIMIIIMITSLYLSSIYIYMLYYNTPTSAISEL